MGDPRRPDHRRHRPSHALGSPMNRLLRPRLPPDARRRHSRRLSFPEKPMRLRAHVLPFALLLACAGAGAHAAQDTAPASTPAATPADFDDTPPAPPPGADQVTVLTAARIHTEDLAQPQVTAIAWDGQGRIVATGKASELR